MTAPGSVLDIVRRRDVDAARTALTLAPEELDARDADGVSLLLLCLYHRLPELAQ